MQAPPWQLVEQHSAPAVQAFPSVVQLETVGLTCAQKLPVHTPEQQSLDELQLEPIVAHAVPQVVPERHVNEQHSVDDAQLWPEFLQ